MALRRNRRLLHAAFAVLGGLASMAFGQTSDCSAGLACTTELRGFPSFSPDAKHVFVWAGLDATGDTQPTAEIFSIAGGTLQSRWKGVTGGRA